MTETFLLGLVPRAYGMEHGRFLLSTPSTLLPIIYFSISCVLSGSNQFSDKGRVARKAGNRFTRAHFMSSYFRIVCTLYIIHWDLRSNLCRYLILYNQKTSSIQFSNARSYWYRNCNTRYIKVFNAFHAQKCFAHRYSYQYFVINFAIVTSPKEFYEISK